jgi:hypothetical protein
MRYQRVVVCQALHRYMHFDTSGILYGARSYEPEAPSTYPLPLTSITLSSLSAETHRNVIQNIGARFEQ